MLKQGKALETQKLTPVDEIGNGYVLPTWLMHSQHTIAVLFDQSSTILTANLHFWQVFQGEASSLFQFTKLFSPSDWQQLDLLCQPLFQQTTAQPPVNYRSTHEEQQLEIRWEFSLYAGEKAGCCLGIGQPVSYEAKGRLQLLEKLAASLPVVIYQFHYTPNGKVTIPFVSPQLANLWGIEPNSILQNGQTIFEAIHPEDLGAVADRLQQNFVNKEPWNYSFRIIHPEKGVRWMDSYGIPEVHPDQSITWYGYISDCTEERTLKEKAEWLSKTADLTESCILLLSPQFRVIWANRRFLEQSGFSQEAIKGQTLESLECYPGISGQLKPGQRFHGEILTCKKVKPAHWASLQIQPIAEGDNLLGHMLVEEDITGRKLQELALKEAKADYDDLVRLMPSGIYKFKKHTDGRCGFSYLSPRWFVLNGISPDAIQTQDALPFHIFHPDDAPEFMARHAYAIQHNAPFECEARHLVHGTYHWMYVRSYPRELPDGSVEWIGNQWDITDKKNQEHQLAQSEEKFRLIAENTSDGIGIISAGNILTYVSPSYARQLGFSQEALIGLPLENILAMVHPNDVERVMQRIQKAWQQQEEDYYLTLRVRKQDGGYIWREDHIKQFFDEKGAIRQTYVVSRDITARKKAEASIRYLKGLYILLLEISNYFINVKPGEIDQAILTMLSKVGKFVRADRVYVFDYFLEEQILRNTHEWCAEGVQPEIENLQQIPLDAFPEWYETHRQGKIFEVTDVESLPLGHPVRAVIEPQGIQSLITIPLVRDGIAIGFLGFDAVSKKRVFKQDEVAILKLMADLLVNVKEKIRTGEKLQKSQNETARALEIVNQQNSRLLEFAYIVSHNIRSHASNLQGLVNLATLGHAEEQPKYLQMMGKATGNLLTTLNHLNEVITIQKTTALHKEPILLRELVTHTLQSLNYELDDKQVEVILQIPEDLHIQANPAYLESVLLNLLTNAIKYRHPGRQPKIEITALQKENRVACVVADNGMGIDLAQHGHKLFGMFKVFHNHPDARGIGLFITKNQVEAMGGKIQVSSEVGKGTVFTIIL